MTIHEEEMLEEQEIVDDTTNESSNRGCAGQRPNSEHDEL